MTDSAAPSRKAAAALIALTIAIPSEGLRQWAYKDPVGILTVCYGHTGDDVSAKREYSMQECKALLTDDMRESVDRVDRCVPGLPVKVLAAFSDADFNLGGVIACDTKNSTAARMLKAGDLVGACNQLPRWNRATKLGISIELPGLTIRRNKEKALCLEGLA